MSISLTFGDQAENHAGMQKIGNAATSGLTKTELDTAAEKFTEAGYTVEMIALHTYINEPVDEAYVLIIRNGIRALCDGTFHTIEDLETEQFAAQVDTKAFMRGRVVNKRARHNLCYADFAQDPDYENKKGRIVSFDQVPCLSVIRDALPFYFGPKTKKMPCEMNLYYNTNKCGIGFHGDTERRIVVCLRLGKQNPLHYQWFHKCKPVGERVQLQLNRGDVYAMSEKAVGFDWKRRSQYTLRHAAGASNFLSIKGQNVPPMTTHDTHTFNADKKK